MGNKTDDKRVRLNMLLIDELYTRWYCSYNELPPITNYGAVGKIIKCRLLPWVDKCYKERYGDKEVPEDLLYMVFKVIIDEMPNGVPWPLNNNQVKLITILTNIDTAYNYVKGNRKNTPPKKILEGSKFDENGDLILD